MLSDRPLLPPEPGLWVWFTGPARHQEPAQPLKASATTGLPEVAAGQRDDRTRATACRCPLPRRGIRNPRRLMTSIMGMMPVAWIVWAGVITFLLILLVYRSNLTRYEEDQIFLDDSGSHQKKEQEDLLARVNKIQPLIRVVTGVTCVLTAGILGVYVWDALQHLM